LGAQLATVPSALLCMADSIVTRGTSTCTGKTRPAARSQAGSTLSASAGAPVPARYMIPALAQGLVFCCAVSRAIMLPSPEAFSDTS